MHTPRTLILHKLIYSGHGEPRRVAISLPYVSLIADEPRYRPAPPNAAPPPPARARSEFERRERRGPLMTDRYIRKVLGRDPDGPRDPDFERALQRIEARGY